MKLCWYCGTEILLERKIQRADGCPKCKQALKCCKNCGFHDPASHNKCREPAAEWVRDKELANFCEFFDFADGRDRARATPQEDVKKRFDSLFRK